MGSTDVIKEALSLRPQERYMVVQALLKSLDEQDAKIDELWENEAKKRLDSYKSGTQKTISMDAIFNED